MNDVSARVAALACAAVALILGAAPAAGATPAAARTAVWNVQPAPDPVVPSGRLTGVSCASASACTAVGFYDNAPGNGMLAEAWDGTSWSLQHTPSPAGAMVSVLQGVSCPAPGSCVAVGGYQNAAGRHVTLAEAWNGSAWSVQPTPNPAGARRSYLFAVSCVSVTACTATGSYQDRTGRHVTLAEAWNGSAWSIQPTPSPSATRNTLLGVSCTAAASCIAVGADQQAQNKQIPLAEVWNGTSWTVQHVPSPVGGATLSAVSCTSASACTAIGTIAEVWDGTSWHIQQTFPGAFLSGISCPSAGFCLAAGSDIQEWNGSSWSVLSNPAGGSSSLLAVSCASASACAVAGYDQPAAQPLATLAEAWDGTSLSVQPTPNPAAVTPSGLDGVSCASPTACAAVGSFNDGSGALVPLAELLTGAGWSIEPVPLPPGAVNGAFNGVSCPLPAACTAVGWYENAASHKFTLAEAWNGTAWSVQPTPSPSVMVSALNGVSCPSPGACVAAGYAGKRTLAEAWNGTSWSVQHSPNPRAAAGSQLAAVSCPSAGDCAAVGGYVSLASGQHGLAERWNGTAWSLQHISGPPGTAVAMTGVSCTSAVSCTAVGSSVGTGVSHTLAAAWDGTAWLLQKIPSPAATGGSFLTGVTCTSAGACAAVGGSGAAPLAEAWNGTTWSVQRARVPVGSLAGVLEDVSCVPAGPCTAVGDHANSIGTELTLVDARS